MAQPAPAAFPSENKDLIVKELKSQIDFFSSHLQKAMDNRLLQQDDAFLKELSESIQNLDRYIKSLKFKDLPLNAKATIEEVVSILSPILHLTLEIEQQPHVLLDAAKNNASLSLFLSALEKYPESFRVLIQELDLLSQDLQG